jgi:hypothetical protein
MPILLEPTEDSEKTDDSEEVVTPKVKRGRKKKQVIEVPDEVVVELTEEELKEYEDLEVEE